MLLTKKARKAYEKAEKAEIKVTGIRKAINEYNYYNTFNGITNVYRQGYIVCNFDTLTVRYTKEIENEQLESTLENNEIVIIDAKSYVGMSLNTAIKFRVYELIAKEIEAERKEAEKKQEAERKEALKDLNTRLEAEKSLNARIEAEKTEYKKIYSPFYTHTYTMISNDYKIKVGEYLVLCGICFFHTFSQTTIQIAQTADYKRVYKVVSINENEGKITVEHIETKEKYYFYFGYFIEQNEVKTTNTKKYTYAYNKAENKEVKAMIAYNFYNYLTNVLCYDTENWEKISKIISIHLDNKAVEAVIYFDEHNNYWRLKKDRQLKINFDTNFASLEKIDDKVLNSSIKNTALFNYLLDDDTTNCFTNNELYQQIKLCEIEAKKKANNTINNIYSYHFLSYLLTHKTEKQVYTALKNKDIVYYFDELLKIRVAIHKAINNCKVNARKNKLMYYYHCLNCINEINEKYQSDNSLELLKQTLFKEVA